MPSALPSAKKPEVSVPLEEEEKFKGIYQDSIVYRNEPTYGEFLKVLSYHMLSIIEETGFKLSLAEHTYQYCKSM